uniref:Uncharacterized protein n=1 Tax=Rhipicephalus zambeziensis TaxID=60191 RepID=A0A224YFU3_9ACAR
MKTKCIEISHWLNFLVTVETILPKLVIAFATGFRGGPEISHAHSSQRRPMPIVFFGPRRQDREECSRNSKLKGITASIKGAEVKTPEIRCVEIERPSRNFNLPSPVSTPIPRWCGRKLTLQQFPFKGIRFSSAPLMGCRNSSQRSYHSSTTNPFSLGKKYSSAAPAKGCEHPMP